MENEKKKNNKINSRFHHKSVEETIEELYSHIDGLSSMEAKERLEEYGENTIRGDDARNPLFIFFKQFKSFLILILVIAAAISFAVGKNIDGSVIMAIILLNAFMGFFQEYRAEKAINALKKMLVPTAKVYREGELTNVSSKDIVPGDIVFIEEGDRIPADMRVIESRNLRTMEASLTGESVPKNKSTEAINESTDFADRSNMAFMGTFVAAGKGKGVVVSTGDSTAFGSIAKDIEGIQRSGGHFEEKIKTLAKQMGTFALAGALTIFLIGFFVRGMEFTELFLFTIAALVSGIPEGLPAILVIVLAIGASRMAKKNSIIRRLSATETLGVATHIITDKTGTLTQNTMNVRKILLLGREINVTGEGWEPKGDFMEMMKMIAPLEDGSLRKLIHVAAVCNNARVVKDNGNHSVVGAPTEAALAVLAEKAGIKKEVVESTRIDDMPFSSKLKFRASIATENEENKEMYVVGAPEVVMSRSSFILTSEGERKISESERKEMLCRTEEMTDKSMRTIAIAYRKEEEDEVHENKAHDLVFVGVVGMIDPPRPEVKGAIEKAKSAGIRPIMATGDHKGTALSIAKEIGLTKENKAYTEGELLEMSEKEFFNAVREVSVFARLTPHMKLKITEALQKDGAVVAMTGDGVNDAPALKRADIGVAMGITGTDVAKEAGEIVLVDDNFASIVNAIEEGRIVFTNTRQASASLITTNFAEHATLITALLLNFKLPLLPTHILWLNLVTDGIFGVSLASEPGHGNILKKPPRDRKENILNREIIPYFVIMVVIMATIALSVFYYFLPDIDKARTGVFTVMAFTQVFNAVNMRSIELSVFKIGLLSNRYFIISFVAAFVLQIMVIELPFFQHIFHFESLSALEFITIVAMSSSVFFAGEVYKYIRYSLIGKR